MNEKEEQTVDFKVYDVPVELKNKYISMAKLDYDNQMWRVLEEGMKRLEEERKNKVPELEERIDDLQKQLVYLKSRLDEIEDKEASNASEPSTFGG